MRRGYYIVQWCCIVVVFGSVYLWIRSHWYAISLGISPHPFASFVEVSLSRGDLEYRRISVGTQAEADSEFTRGVSMWWKAPPRRLGLDFLQGGANIRGFRLGRFALQCDTTDPYDKKVRVLLPFWVWTATWAVLGVCLWRRVHSKRCDYDCRRCVNCGYDLRASPTRCPECGLLRR